MLCITPNVSVPLRGNGLATLQSLKIRRNSHVLFQSPCGEMVLRRNSMKILPVLVYVFQSPCGEMVLRQGLEEVSAGAGRDCFSPLAGKWSCDLSLRREHEISWIFVSVPLRGNGLATSNNLASTADKKVRCFSPLAGKWSCDRAIFSRKNERSKKFQSPCGEMVLRRRYAKFRLSFFYSLSFSPLAGKWS